MRPAKSTTKLARCPNGIENGWAFHHSGFVFGHAYIAMQSQQEAAT